MRVRKNAAKMTDAEWKCFCLAVVKLKHTYHAGSGVSVYDQFVAQHQGVRTLVYSHDQERAVPDGAHGGPAFLPWHREYLRRFEAALMAVDAGVTLPYWNWGLGDDSETEGLFDSDDRLGPRTGVLTSGYFSLAGRDGLGWAVHDSLRISDDEAEGQKEALERNMSWAVSSLPSAKAVFDILDLTSYEDFRRGLEAIHGDVHVLVGGHMRRASVSPNDPIFFLHHAQVDRLWALWQLRHPQARYVGDPNRNGHGVRHPMWPWNGGYTRPRAESILKLVPMYATTDIVRPRDVIDTRELGYIYDGEDVHREAGQVELTHDWKGVRLLNTNGYTYGYESAIVTGIQTFNGPDTASVRVRGANGQHFELMVEEETSRDAERWHATERVAYLTGRQGVILNAAGEVVGELGTLKMGNLAGDNRFKAKILRHRYTKPVVVAAVSSYDSPHPAHIRVGAVGRSSIHLAVEGWDHRERWPEDVGYVVMESGRHLLRDGSQVEAGRGNVDDNWKRVTFSDTLGADTIVLSQCMTWKDKDPVVTRQNNVGGRGFDVRLQEAEGSDGAHVHEEVGYIAIGSGE